jgi:DNA-3-methyladenine glycosylase II
VDVQGLDRLTPTTISQFSAEQMRAIGISGRKASYLHDLAANFLSGALSDSDINNMDDESLMKALTAVKGIGVWSVHMFMLFSLHKADVLPVSDLGVRKGLQKLYSLKELPNPAQAEKIASCWQPYRSLGSWYMWRVISNAPKPEP